MADTRNTADNSASSHHKSDSLLSGILSEEQRKSALAAVKQTEQFIAENPIASLSLALAAGVVVGWFVKRR